MHKVNQPIRQQGNNLINTSKRSSARLYTSTAHTHAIWLIAFSKFIFSDKYSINAFSCLLVCVCMFVYQLRGRK